MKKLWIILLSTLLAFGFGVISCGDGSVPDYSAPGGGDEEGGGDDIELPDNIVKLTGISKQGSEDYQQGWDIKALVADLGAPTHLLLFQKGGADGVGGTNVIFNSKTDGWKQTKTSGDWAKDGTWAATPKCFVVDLTATTSYNATNLETDAANTTDGYVILIFAFSGEPASGNGSQLKFSAFDVAYLVFDGDSDYDDFFDDVCVTANAIANDGTALMWYIDDVEDIDEIGILDE
jgi:hypothetical protein